MDAIQAGAQPGPAVKDHRFSVMIWTLKSRGSFEQNLERVAKAGYRYVELIGESLRWSDAETAHMLARMDALGISVDATSGLVPGFADPAATATYPEKLKEFAQAAQRVRCKRLILFSGKRVQGMSDQDHQRVSIETLKRAADVLEQTGTNAVLEPIDRLENPPIWMDTVEQAFEIVEAVASPRIKVLYDLYHEQRTHGNLIEKLQKNIHSVGLIHVADVPGRHEPGTGEIHYANIYRKLGELKYDGMIAMEFYPTGEIVESLRGARLEASQAIQLRR
ncbi:hydroxypyruvate isomerase [Edaphobacter modestus]|uniref:Hydroxypyruvate isomerase n=2 Tax=Edaphobacter modestus TaxID=388466 RepID=A0A4Q7YUF4_9BACT|nr:hydroxypyruvate isomerase [Edaphobacter modestus]